MDYIQLAALMITCYIIFKSLPSSIERGLTRRAMTRPPQTRTIRDQTDTPGIKPHHIIATGVSNNAITASKNIDAMAVFILRNPQN